MLYAGFDLSRQRLDVHVLDEEGRTVEVTAATPEVFGLRELVARISRHGQAVSAVIESMNGARFVHDQLELYGWDVEIADAVKVKGLAPLAAKVLAELSRRDLVPAIRAARPDRPRRARASPLPAPPRAPPDRPQEPDPRHPHRVRPPGPGERPLRDEGTRAAREPGRPRALGHDACHEPPDRRRARGRDRAVHGRPAGGRGGPSVCPPAHERSRDRLGALGYTIAAELGDIGRFASPKKLAGYTGLCPIVRQSGRRDDRGPLAKNGPKYLRWALIEAATHAARHPAYRERYEHTKKRLGRQRGAKVARVELARELSTAIWHMLTKNEPFAPGRPPVRALVA
jgi:transposase